MPEDLMELETPVEEPVVDETTGTAETDETTQTEETGEKTPVTSLFQADGKKLDPQVSAQLAKIKAENPEIAKLLNRAVYRVAEIDREFPGGVTEAKELRDKVEEFGGVDGITVKMESLAEMDKLGEAYMSSDPAFVDDLVESSPEAFAALAPLVMNKLSEVNSEAFSAYVGRVVLNDLNAAGIPLMMMRMQDLIPTDNAQLKAAFDQINGYLGGFKTLAEKPLPKVGAAKPAVKGDDLSKREEALRIKEWQAERDSTQRTIVNSEYTKILAGRKPDGEEKAQILELFRSRSMAAADRLFPGWKEKSQRYIANNDKAGYIRYMKSIYTRVVPEAMASSVNSTLKGKKAVAATVKKPAAAAAKGAPVADGFKLVSAEPDSWAVDYGRTTRAMIQNNQAVLKDGSKVSWR